MVCWQGVAPGRFPGLSLDHRCHNHRSDDKGSFLSHLSMYKWCWNIEDLWVVQLRSSGIDKVDQVLPEDYKFINIRTFLFKGNDLKMLKVSQCTTLARKMRHEHTFWQIWNILVVDIPHPSPCFKSFNRCPLGIWNVETYITFSRSREVCTRGLHCLSPVDKLKIHRFPLISVARTWLAFPLGPLAKSTEGTLWPCSPRGSVILSALRISKRLIQGVLPALGQWMCHAIPRNWENFSQWHQTRINKNDKVSTNTYSWIGGIQRYRHRRIAWTSDFPH